AAVVWGLPHNHSPGSSLNIGLTQQRAQTEQRQRLTLPIDVLAIIQCWLICRSRLATDPARFYCVHLTTGLHEEALHEGEGDRHDQCERSSGAELSGHPHFASS